MLERDLININDVAEIFGLSLETIRKYKQIGLIRACITKGKKDLFNKNEIIIRKNRIESLKKDGLKLDEITADMKRFEKTMPTYLTFKEGQKKILIIEDDEAVCGVILKMISIAFNKDMLNIITTDNGESAIEIAKQMVPDLIISDVLLGQKNDSMTAMELYPIIKNDPITQKAEFLFLSGKVRYQPENTQFLIKPFDIIDLIEVVGNLLGMPVNPIFRKLQLNPT